MMVAPDRAGFEACFLVFHPFARVAVDALLYVSREGDPTSDRFNPFTSDLYWNHWLLSIYGRPVRWSEISNQYFRGNIEKMAEAIYCGAVGASSYGKVPELLDEFFDLLDRQKTLIQPVEGNLSPMLFPDIAWLGSVTGQRVQVYSYIGDRVLPADALTRWWWVPNDKPYSDYWKDVPAACCMGEFGAEDRSWHIVTPCEAQHSFLLGPKSLLNRMVRERRLEGFWYDQNGGLFDWIAPDPDPEHLKWSEVVLWS